MFHFVTDFLNEGEHKSIGNQLVGKSAFLFNPDVKAESEAITWLALSAALLREAPGFWKIVIEGFIFQKLTPTSFSFCKISTDRF